MLLTSRLEIKGEWGPEQGSNFGPDWLWSGMLLGSEKSSSTPGHLDWSTPWGETDKALLSPFYKKKNSGIPLGPFTLYYALSQNSHLSSLLADGNNVLQWQLEVFYWKPGASALDASAPGKDCNGHTFQHLCWHSAQLHTPTAYKYILLCDVCMEQVFAGTEGRFTLHTATWRNHAGNMQRRPSAGTLSAFQHTTLKLARAVGSDLHPREREAAVWERVLR